jgi:hypothetical protein
MTYKRTIRSYSELSQVLDGISSDKETAQYQTLEHIAKRIIPHHFEISEELYKPLSPKYNIWKIKHYGRLPILSRTLVLRTLVRRNWRIVRSAGSYKIVWNLTRYAKYVRQTRDFLALTPKDRKNISQQRRRIYRRLRSRRF